MQHAYIERAVSQLCANTFGVKELSASRIKRQESGLWQRRFREHQIRDEIDFERHVNYIHSNPVKHGLFLRGRDWTYSTFQRLVRDGVYPAD